MVLAYAEPLSNHLQRPARQTDRPGASALRELEFLHLLAVAPCDFDASSDEAGERGDSHPVAA